MLDPYDLCSRDAVAIQSAAMRFVSDYLREFPTMIRVGQGPAAEALAAELGELPSEWDPEDIAPALFRIAVRNIASDSGLLATYLNPPTRVSLPPTE